MGLFNTPQMTLAEFKHRVEPFLHSFPHTRWAEYAQQILNRIEFCQTDNPIDPEWWNLISEDLPREAVQLGAYIIYGNQHTEDNKLDLDLTGMPEVYREPFRQFVTQMAEVMVSGVDKGYTMQDTYDNGIEWQAAEGRMKFKEFLNLYKRGEKDRAAKVVVKTATAGLVSWTAFCYYSPDENDRNQQEWC